jgi:sec-independent protein translocase protein TatA
MLGGLGFAELLVFGTIALLLFGKRLPSVAKSLGQGIREFQQGVRGVTDDLNSSVHSSLAIPEHTEHG